MTERTTRDRNCGRLLILTAGLIGAVPLLSAQTAKELMADACYNEIQQHKHDTFWTSEIQRREKGHVYLEREIETPSGPVHRLILVDGHEPSLMERKSDDDQLRKLMSNPKAQEEMRKSHESSEKNIEDLLSVIPNAFLFEDLGRQGNAERLGFRPNPAYVPKSYMEIAMHALNGTVLIDRQENRLIELSAILTQQVNIGFGLLGSLKKGGTIHVRHARIQPGTWKTIFTSIDISGRVVLVKAISKKQEESQSNFAPVSSEISVDQAIKALFASDSIHPTGNAKQINF